MKKYSILILLIMCLFLEVYFEKQFPYITIIYGLILGVLSFYAKNTSDKRKGLKLLVSYLFYIVKYIMAFHLILVYLVFMNYLHVSDSILFVHYAIITITLLSLVGLDLFTLVKYYYNKLTLNSN